MPLEMKNNTTSINALNNLDKAQNELSDSLRRLSSGQKINTAAESTLRDSDMAQELATFTRNQIMSQSATAQLAQANAMPQNVLRLLNT